MSSETMFKYNWKTDYSTDLEAKLIFLTKFNWNCDIFCMRRYFSSNSGEKHILMLVIFSAV